MWSENFNFQKRKTCCGQRRHVIVNVDLFPIFKIKMFIRFLCADKHFDKIVVFFFINKKQKSNKKKNRMKNLNLRWCWSNTNIWWLKIFSLHLHWLGCWDEAEEKYIQRKNAVLSHWKTGLTHVINRCLKNSTTTTNSFIICETV